MIDNQALILFYENGQLICHDVKTGRLLYENQAYAANDAEKYNRSGVMLIYGKGFYMIRNGEKGAILLRYETEDRQWKEVMRSDYHLNNLVMHDGKLYIASEWGYFTYSLSTGEIVHHKKLALNNGESLETDINTIEFDRQGGMWIGTENSGIYLIEDDTITVAHFTTDNSLLPSNTIQSMAIMPTTGELFIGTAKGIASYRSDASAPQEDLKNAYAFPNPVRPNYDGVITIAGLMENTAVNIIDESGNLVCKTRSYGGTAVWDGRIQNGRLATSGVYTALCNEPTGKHTVVKILVIR